MKTFPSHPKPSDAELKSCATNWAVPTATALTYSFLCSKKNRVSAWLRYLRSCFPAS